MPKKNKIGTVSTLKETKKIFWGVDQKETNFKTETAHHLFNTTWVDDVLPIYTNFYMWIYYIGDFSKVFLMSSYVYKENDKYN